MIIHWSRCNFRDDSEDWRMEGADYAGEEAYMQIIHLGLESHQSKKQINY